jgi:hypothetical protein
VKGARYEGEWKDD